MRRDIQGLRAVAVIAVILDHLLGWPLGGFVGVDVFFVLSGFLITGLLLREQERTGRISFVDFYRRRIKRLLPASTLVLLVTLGASFVVFTSTRFSQTVGDSIWAFFFAANWRFASIGTDYFEATGPVSPLQHFWSLAVEEQFYLVWPWLMLAIFSIIGHRRGLARGAVGATMVLIVGASFSWALLQTQTETTVAYFSTFTRAWELGVGALIAVAAPALRRIPGRIRPLIGWVGVIGILVAVFTTDAESGFPAPGAALPVVGTALVILAGTGGKQRFMWPLTSRPAAYAGDISYSLYLWHFPVIVILSAVIGAGNWYFYVGAAALTILLSVLSYHFVEEPFRRAPLLDRFETRGQRAEAISRWSRQWVPKYKRAGVAFVVVSWLLIVTSALVPRAAPAWTAPPSAALSTSSGGNETGPQAAVSGAITAALTSESWPELSPSLDTLAVEGRPAEDVEGCDRTRIDNPSSCAYGDPSKPTMIVLGDSTGITLMPTVRAAYGEDYFIRGLTMASCPVPFEKAFGSETDAQNCATHKAEAIAEINRVKPAAVFVITWSDTARTMKSKATGTAMQEEWRSGLQTTIDSFASVVGDVVVVSAAPAGKSLADCATVISTPTDCVSEIPDTYYLVSEAESSVTGANVHHYDTRSWFCSDDGFCPAFAGSTPLKRDSGHTTRQWASEVAPLFKETVDPWLAT